MTKNNYLKDILAGEGSRLLEKDSIRKLTSFIRCCKSFFKIDFSMDILQKDNLCAIRCLLRAWLDIKRVFLDEAQFDSGEAIKQYYNCYEFHPYIDCFDLLTRDLCSELSELKFDNDQLILEQDTPIVNKLIIFNQQYKAKFLTKSIRYKKTDEYRYKQVIDYYEQFKQLPFQQEEIKRFTIFSFMLAIPKGFLWAQLYHAIQQMYKCFNELSIKYNVLVVRTITVNGNELKFQFICMGGGYPDLNGFIFLCASIFSRFLNNGFKLINDSVITIPDNKQQVDKLENQHKADKNAKGLIRNLLNENWQYRTNIKGLYSFQILNKQAITMLKKDES